MPKNGGEGGICLQLELVFLHQSDYQRLTPFHNLIIPNLGEGSVKLRDTPIWRHCGQLTPA
jgi:hypothetical protein